MQYHLSRGEGTGAVNSLSFLISKAMWFHSFWSGMSGRWKLSIVVASFVQESAGKPRCQCSNHGLGQMGRQSNMKSYHGSNGDDVGAGKDAAGEAEDAESLQGG